MFKNVYSLYSAFFTQLHFTLSLQSAFYTQSAFYPWSAVCSPQSAFYTDRFSNKSCCTGDIVHTSRLFGAVGCGDEKYVFSTDKENLER